MTADLQSKRPRPMLEHRRGMADCEGVDVPDRTCERCDRQCPTVWAKYCSEACRTIARTAHHESMKSPLRQAIEAGDHAAILREIRARTTLGDGGCWLWTGAVSKAGYPHTMWHRHRKPIHRIALAAHLGAPIGDQTVHHVCATRRCVNPEHLQQATARDNVCEMMARADYVRRIEQLENALRDVRPDHPLLAEHALGGVVR